MWHCAFASLHCQYYLKQVHKKRSGSGFLSTGQLQPSTGSFVCLFRGKKEALNGAFVVWVGDSESTRNTDCKIPGPSVPQIPQCCTWVNVNKCLLCPSYSPFPPYPPDCFHVLIKATDFRGDIWVSRFGLCSSRTRRRLKHWSKVYSLKLCISVES